ncbi:hypothetical protein MTF65_14020 [Streptomyces sp. APSN-46.1]|uniref:hypothetical protein n=1 Tax=Streptomyces sp. APSN-46.1 TaxID=2929049 RepID=UPI001FB30262|nr:hypothetical protein [Streptomyces sp. APSN-46.1]MCJ1678444.1 hypothetical protein [Streptomyces sp. APSN-46.1]
MTENESPGIPTSDASKPGVSVYQTTDVRRTSDGGPVAYVAYRATWTIAAAEVIPWLVLSGVTLVGAIIALVVGFSAEGPDLTQCDGLFADTQACRGEDAGDAFAWAAVLLPLGSLSTAIVLWLWPVEYRRKP